MGSRRNKTGFVWFALVAIALHVWLLRQQLPEGFVVSSPTASNKTPIEIERAKDLPVVQSQQAERTVDNKNKARFGGEFTQRVEKETQAARKGLLAQGGGAAGSDSPGAPNEAPDNLERSEEGLLPKRSGGPRLRDLLALGQSPDQLPDEIVTGDNTVLNTDAVSYASFMRRITDEIYQPWVNNLTRAVQEMQLDKQHLGANVYTTRLAISMDDNGRVTAIQTLKSSGIASFDEAPKRAFWEQDPFPNPPEQMRKTDGSFRFVYEFHFEYKTSAFNILPWAI